jgi:hypothetical protein
LSKYLALFFCKKNPLYVVSIVLCFIQALSAYFVEMYNRFFKHFTFKFIWKTNWNCLTYHDIFFTINSIINFISSVSPLSMVPTLWRPRGPSSEHFWQVWLISVQRFQRRRFKCEKLTDGRTTDTYPWQKLTWPMARWALLNLYEKQIEIVSLTMTFFLPSIQLSTSYLLSVH